MAMKALEKFYKDNNLALVQSASADESAAPGEAPAPPPTTFEGDYGGEKDEHNGVVGILTLIKEDVEKDIRVATAAEEKAEAEFKAFMQESEDTISNLEQQIDEFQSAHAKAETA